MQRGAAFAADGKGINNVLAFPGLFRGALAAHAALFTDAMLMAAADAIAQLAGGGPGAQSAGQDRPRAGGGRGR